MSYIEIYTKKKCPYCNKAKELLIKKSLDFKEICIDENELVNDLYLEMKKRSGGRTTVPQIFIDNNYIGGADDLIFLNNQGKLDSILVSANNS